VQALAISSIVPTTATLAAVPNEMIVTVLGAGLVLMALALAAALLLVLGSAGEGSQTPVPAPVEARVAATFPRAAAQLRPPLRDGLRASRPSRAPPDSSIRPRPTLPAEEPDA
jgi:hypothetical protein